MRQLGELQPPEALEGSLSLTLFPGSFTVPWSQCGATADFLAAYAAGMAEGTRATEELSYAVNELLENALKYCAPGAPGSIDITIGTAGSDVFCVVKNSVAGAADALHDALAQRLAGDPLDALVRRVEENAERGDLEAGLGLLTLLADYDVALGFRIHDAAPSGNLLLETVARIPGARHP